VDGDVACGIDGDGEVREWRVRWAAREPNTRGPSMVILLFPSDSSVLLPRKRRRAARLVRPPACFAPKIAIRRRGPIPRRTGSTRRPTRTALASRPTALPDLPRSSARYVASRPSFGALVNHSPERYRTFIRCNDFRAHAPPGTLPPGEAGHSILKVRHRKGEYELGSTRSCRAAPLGPPFAPWAD
jgi:hypothetical protein